MENFLEIIRERQSPGILVFDFNNQLLYSNREILSMIPGILATDDQKNDWQAAIFKKILGLCDRLKLSLLPDSQGQTQKISKTCTLMIDGLEQLISLRAFVIDVHNSANGKGHIMVMSERVVENHDRNFEKIKKDFNFSNRELDVLKQVCAGLSNRVMAEKLFISEQTVKSHLKNIMKKMKASSRNEIMAALKS